MYIKNIEDVPSISIVVPMYNVEKYIIECLESLNRQTLKSIEIIIVDDNSTDNSYKLALKFAENKQNFRIYTRPKGNYATSVNYGFEQAFGEYLQIVEPDDYISDDYCLMLYNEAKSSDADICGVCGYCEINDVSNEHALIYTYYNKKSLFFSKHDKLKFLGFGSPGITLKIYKKKFIIKNNLFLNETTQISQDVDFVPLAIMAAEKVRIFEGTGYFYRRHEDQSVKSSDHLFSILQKCEDLLEEAFRRGLYSVFESGLIGYISTQLYTRILKSKAENYSYFESIFESTIKKYLLKVNHVICKHTASNYINKLFKGTVEPVPPSYVSPVDIESFMTIRRNGASIAEQLGVMYSNIYYSLNVKSTETVILAARQCIIFLNFVKIESAQIRDFFLIVVFKYYVEMKKADEAALGDILAYLKKYKNFDSKIVQNYASLKNFNEDSIAVSHGETSFFRLTKSFASNHTTGSYVAFEKSSEQKFLNYISGKSIAIVGNSPCEIGTGKGEFIDSHDVVIRFNNYALGKGKELDYGSKVNIWGITPSLDSLLDYSDLYNYDFVFSVDSPAKFMGGREKFFETLRLTSRYFFRIKSLPLQMMTNLQIPSLGLYTLHYLLSYVGVFHHVNIFGFSLTDHYQGKRHYFEGDPTAIENVKFHKWDQEFVFFEMFRDHFAKII